MDTLSAFAIGQANKDKEPMVFDWIKAAKEIKKRKAKEASAGLSQDWEWTGGAILKNGKPYKKDDTFLASTWAVPELKIGGKIIPCYIMQSERPSWDSHTKWPKEALDILKKGK